MSLNQDLAAGVFRALARMPRRGRGRTVMLIAARRGEGVSRLARALITENPAGTGLLIDLDVMRNSQHAFFQEAALQDGPALGAPIDGRLKGRAFFRLVSQTGAPRPDPGGLFSFHRIGRSRGFVGGFDHARLAAGERVQILAGPDYWDAVRQSCEVCVVDAPALERSRAGLAAAAHVDAVVIVANGAFGKAAKTQALRAELEAVGAPLAGVVYMGADPLAERLSRLFAG